jgi:hypothetical protein
MTQPALDQRQLGHADLGITSAYLRGIDNSEIVHAVHERPAPMIPAGPTPLRLSRAALSHTSWRCLSPAALASGTSARAPQHGASRHDQNSATVAGCRELLATHHTCCANTATASRRRRDRRRNPEGSM